MTVSWDRIGAITLFVEDVDRAKAWYRSVFDRPVTYEDNNSAVIEFDNAIVNLLTIWVEDADAACADLQARGVTLLNGPIDRKWGQRTAGFADPDGHIWEIAQT